MNSFVLLSLLFAAAIAVPANFAPYGPGAGDSTLPRNDDSYVGPIAFNFIFYGVLRTSLFVNNNGLLSFNGGISSYTPTGMSGANFPAIAPYWADVDTRSADGGFVYYRSTTDAALLATWSAKISSDFHGNRAFIATYDHVGYYSEKTNKLNNFQTILIADAIGNSYVFCNYAGLQWTTGDASGGSNGLGGVPASVGFSDGTGHNYYQTPSSLTADVINTQDFHAQVNRVVIEIVQTCGNGIREGTEACDGGDCCSSTCTIKAAGTQCRGSNGVCDVAETCTGSSPSCPADSFQSAATTCRASAGDCDVAESCTGSSASCPADSFQSATTTCRASAGDCDVAETCTGSSASCPADSFQSSSTLCRASAGDCDVAEYCSGSASSCPSNTFAPSTYTCRPAADGCDIAEQCSGSTAACPADVLSMTGPCFCGRQGITEPKNYPDYFCTANPGKFYMCVYGAFLPQSALMSCGAGTSCGCADGTECSCSATRSPCVMSGQTQTC